VDSIENETSARSEVIDASANLVSSWSGVPWQHTLRVDAAAVEINVLSNFRFSSRVSIPAALTCTGFRMSIPDSSVGNKA